MANNKFKLVTVEYQTRDKGGGYTDWKCGVLAYNMDEAIKTVKDAVPTFDRVTAVGVNREIDIISQEIIDSVKEYILSNNDNLESYTKNNDDGPLTCPFCKKEYKSERTLLTHIYKFHHPEDHK